MDNWLVAARLVAGRCAKPVTHSYTESNTPAPSLGGRPHARSENFSIGKNGNFSVAIDRPAQSFSRQAASAKLARSDSRLRESSPPFSFWIASTTPPSLRHRPCAVVPLTLRIDHEEPTGEGDPCLGTLILRVRPQVWDRRAPSPGLRERCRFRSRLVSMRVALTPRIPFGTEANPERAGTIFCRAEGS